MWRQHAWCYTVMTNSSVQLYTIMKSAMPARTGQGGLNSRKTTARQFHCGVVVGHVYSTCVSSPRLSLCTSESVSVNTIFKWFSVNSCWTVMCTLDNIQALRHIQLQLRTYIYMAIVCTYSCRDYNTSVMEMLPSLTRLEPRYDVTHTDSDGNVMKKLPGSVSPRLQPR